jgi:phosphatidylserine/phosphatidylglycerophosphate/cardiolipin synthase-like enzyme
MSEHTILKPGRNCWHVGEVTKTGLLVDARDYYRAFYHTARAARRYILISGWQIDSNVVLLRGEDAKAAGEEAPLISFLNNLCEQNSALRIFILAWDFSMVYSLDREWFQEWYFNWKTNDRLKFCFDSCDSIDACHHQKFVVIDGKVAFVGGLDLCSGRWDQRDHRVNNPLRVNPDQSPYKPFHDVQSSHSGPVAQKLAEFFTERWKCVGGEELDLPAEPSEPAAEPELTIPIAARTAAISRTLATTSGGREPVREIRQLFLDAIAAAEHLIYIENQYFSSAALFKALIERMTDRSRSPLEIILIIAADAEAISEQLSIGIAQERVMRGLQEAARENGHSLGIYHPVSVSPEGEDLPTYIHSKLFLIDDRFLNVGSANMNNRSMGYDTELNVAWEGSASETELVESIREVRVNLLAEHTGLDAAARNDLCRVTGLVQYLNGLAETRSGRLRYHPVRIVPQGYQWITSVLPDGLPFDAEASEDPERIYERLSTKQDSFFTQGLTSLKNWLADSGAKSDDRKP